MGNDNCFICGGKLNSQIESDNSTKPRKPILWFSCKICGVYPSTSLFLSNLAILMEKEWGDPECNLKLCLEKFFEENVSLIKKDKDVCEAILRYYMRKTNNRVVDINKENALVLNKDGIIEILEKEELPPLSEQVDNLITYIAQKVNPGNNINFDTGEDYSRIGSINPKGAKFIKDYLIQYGYIKEFHNIPNRGIENSDLQLTFEGWNKYFDLKRGAVNSKKAFMAMAFRDDLTPFCKKLHDAVNETGFRLERVDESRTVNEKGQQIDVIDNKIMVDILTSRFVIADLSYANPGVYWEAGYAQGLGKNVIYTCRKDHFEAKEDEENYKYKPHFDVNHRIIIPWEEDKLDVLGETIKNDIRVMFPQDEVIMEDKKQL